jgi:hypothetical protein
VEEGAWLRIDVVDHAGRLFTTLFGDDGSPQIRGIVFRAWDLEAATPPWLATAYSSAG